MIVAFTRVGAHSVSLTAMTTGVRVVGIKKNAHGAVSRRCSKEYPCVDLGDLVAQIDQYKHGLLATGWEASVERIGSSARVKFTRLEGISARLQAANF